MISKPKLNRILQHPLKNILNHPKGIKVVKNLVQKLEIEKVMSCIKLSEGYLHPDKRKKPIQRPARKPLKLKNPRIVVHKKNTKLSDILLQSELTKKVIVEYGIDLDANMKANTGLRPTVNCLKYHNIPSSLRARMVNWMIEVINIFEIQHQTFFTAVTIMDFFYANTTKMLDSDDVHLTGIVSIFLASKFVDYVPLKMYKVINKIGHGSFTVKQIKEKEREIMVALGFIVGFPTILTFIEALIEDFILKHTELDYKQLKVLDKVKRHSIYFGKLSLYEYDLLKYKYFFLLPL